MSRDRILYALLMLALAMTGVAVLNTFWYGRT